MIFSYKKYFILNETDSLFLSNFLSLKNKSYLSRNLLVGGKLNPFLILKIYYVSPLIYNGIHKFVNLAIYEWLWVFFFFFCDGINSCDLMKAGISTCKNCTAPRWLIFEFWLTSVILGQGLQKYIEENIIIKKIIRNLKYQY